VYLNSIDFNNGASLRISELIAIIHSQFDSIDAVEFNGFNDISPAYQYIGLDPNITSTDTSIPEILNLHHTYDSTLDAFIPDIDIEIIKNS
jgi:hypothetical protein